MADIPNPIDQDKNNRWTVSVIVHEIQIHMQGLLAQAEVLALNLESTVADPKNVAEDARELVRRLEVASLTLANFQSPPMEHPDNRVVNLGDIARAVIDLLGSEALHKGVRIHFRSDVDTALVKGARSQIQLLVYNLLHNAIKYSYSGSSAKERQVQVSVRRVSGSTRDWLELEVENYGVAIAPDELERVFEKGYRGQHSRDRYRTGTGIGLWVAREIARVHGGNLSISSHILSDERGPAVTSVRWRVPAEP